LESLLKKSLDFTDGKKEHVIVVSIPDYSITPFGQKMDAATIKHEIDLFNSVNKHYPFNIKPIILILLKAAERQRRCLLLAEDGLHPSEKEYKKWAAEVIQYIGAQIK
jgi:lysophospholipase L1-like esterase